MFLNNQNLFQARSANVKHERHPNIYAIGKESGS